MIKYKKRCNIKRSKKFINILSVVACYFVKVLNLFSKEVNNCYGVRSPLKIQEIFRSRKYFARDFPGLSSAGNFPSGDVFKNINRILCVVFENKVFRCIKIISTIGKYTYLV